MASKSDFRKNLLGLRKSMPIDARKLEDAQIADNLFSIAQFENTPCVLTYLSFGSEVDTRIIIKHAQKTGKTIAIPKCIEDKCEMKWFEITCFDNLETSALGMEEPRPDLCREVISKEYNRENTVAIVPGLAFDKQGYRIGYGGGFYDKFLSNFSGLSIGLCRNPFMQDNLHQLNVIEEHDLPVDIVITPASVIYTNKAAV